VTVTDALGCKKDTFVNVTAPPAFTIAKSTTPTNCSYDSTGTATITIGGATPGYTYLWSNGNVTNSLSGLAATTYYVTVTDNIGCTYKDSVTISSPTAILTSTSTVAVSCHNGTDGKASVSATGGNPGYTYFWNVDSTTAAISNMAPGT
jgi:hypothetical protein